MSPSDIVLRSRLILEELGELTIAIHEDKIVEILDGLCDLYYVTVGTAVTVGIQTLDQYYNPLKRIVDTDFKVTAIGRLASAVYMVVSNLTMNDMYSIKSSLDRLMNTICDVAAKFGFQFKEAFQEVHRSNMSKNLGGAKDGKKYGDNGPAKGASYTPPDLLPFLPAV